MAQVQGLPPLQVPSGIPRLPGGPFNPGQRMPTQFQPGMQMQPGNFQRPQFPPNTFYRPYKPMLVGVEVDYEGKKLRKSMMRKTVDYNASVIRYLNNRVWQRDFRDRRAIQPDVTYYPELCPPSAYLDDAVNAVTTRYTKVATNKMRCPIFCLSWTPEGRRLITGASSGEFTLWNGLTYNFETILQAHDASVRTMVWSHDDGWMVTGDHNGFVKYWQSNMNNVKMFQAHKEPLRGVSFSPSDHKFATCSDDGTVRIWDFIRCHEERILRGHGADVKCVDWHPHKGLIVSGSKDNQQPIKLWDPRSGTSLTTLHSHKSTVMDIKWNQNGNWLLTASRDHLVKVFDIRQLSNELQVFRGHKKEAACLSWNPVHESLFASGGSDGAILFWHVGIDKEVGAIENAHDNMIWSLSWHPMGHVLASGANDHTTKFWTRNRPGDKMKDKYNLNVLPSTVAAEDAEWEDKSTYLVASNVSQTVKEEKVNIFTSLDDIIVPGLDFIGKVSDVSRSKVTSSGTISSRKGPVEYIEFDEDKIPREPVPMSKEVTVAMKLLEQTLKVMYGVREPAPDTSSLAIEFMKLGVPQYVEKENDETEPIDVKLLPFVTHIIAGAQVVKSEGKSEVFGAARASVERFYESLARRNFYYERKPFQGERTTLNNLTEEELASYDGEGPVPERIIRSPSPVRSVTPKPREPPRRKSERRRDFDEDEDFAGKRGRFEERFEERGRHDDRHEDRRRRFRDGFEGGGRRERRGREDRRGRFEDSFEDQEREFDGPRGRFDKGIRDQQGFDDEDQYPDESFWDDDRGDEHEPMQTMPPWEKGPRNHVGQENVRPALMEMPLPPPGNFSGRGAPAPREALLPPPGGNRRLQSHEEEEFFDEDESFPQRGERQRIPSRGEYEDGQRPRGPPRGPPGPPQRIGGPPHRTIGPDGHSGHLLPDPGHPPGPLGPQRDGRVPPHGPPRDGRVPPGAGGPPFGPSGPRGAPEKGGGPRPPVGKAALLPPPEPELMGRGIPPHFDGPRRGEPDQFRDGPPGRDFGHTRGGGFAGRGRESRERGRNDRPFFEEEEFPDEPGFRPGHDNLPPRSRGRPEFEEGPGLMPHPGREFDDERGGPGGRGRGGRRHFDEENGGFRGGPPGRGPRGERRGSLDNGDERWRNDEEEFYEDGPHGRGPPERGGHRGRGRGREEFRGGPPRGHPHENGTFRGRGRDDRGRGGRRGSHDRSFEEEMPFRGEPRNPPRSRGRSPHEGVPRPPPGEFDDRDNNRRPPRDRKPRFDEEFSDDRGPRRGGERERGRGGRSDRSRGREPPRGR